jgi:hypothetical protein
MVDFSIDQVFSLIIIPSSFGHAMTTEEQLSTLQCIKKHLRVGGMFILDLYPGGKNLEASEFEDAPRRMADGRVVNRSGTISPDVIEQILRVQLTYEIRSSDGSHIETRIVESGAAIIYHREANLLIRMAGFRVLDEFGSFEEIPYNRDSSRRILVLTHGSSL